MSSAVISSRRGVVPKKLKLIGIILAVIVAVLAISAWAATILLRPHPPSPASITRAMQTQAALTGGHKVYATYCAYCHDRGFGPSLANLALVPEALQAIVRSGPAMMPAFPTSQVSDADIRSLTDYINSLPPPGGASK